MFREMRRKAQQLTDERAIEALKIGNVGVLAVLGDDEYPYTIPVNYVYYNSKIYIHCAKVGHKIDAIKNHSKVSFCVVTKDDVIQEKYTTYYESVVAFGRAQFVEDEDEMVPALTELALKYCPDYKDGIPDEISKEMPAVAVISIDIEHLTGKQAKELINA